MTQLAGMQHSASAMVKVSVAALPPEPLLGDLLDALDVADLLEKALRLALVTAPEREVAAVLCDSCQAFMGIAKGVPPIRLTGDRDV